MASLGFFLALFSAGCEGNLQQAAAALQQKNIVEAQSILDSARSQCAQSATFFELDGVTAALSNQLAPAEAAFRKALSLNPNSSRLFTELGVLLLKASQFTEGTKNLEKALAIDPANGGAAQYLIAAYLQAKRTDDVLRLVDKRKLSASVLFSLGVQLASQGRYQEAVHCFGKIPATDADDAVYFNTGLAYSHSKQWNKARENYFKAIDKRVGHADAYLHIGLDYASLGEPRKAIPWLLRAHELAVDKPDTVFVLCEQWIGLKYFQSAENLLKEALARDARQPLLLCASGDLAQAKGDEAMARAAYQEALQQDAKLLPALVGLARCDQAEGNDGAARERLSEALSINPNDSAANEQLGAVEMKQANWAGAAEHLQRSWTGEQSNPNTGLLLARALKHLGKPDEALRILKTIEPRLQDSTEFHLELAQVYGQLHRTSEAEAERAYVGRLQPAANATIRFEDPQTYVY